MQDANRLVMVTLDVTAVVSALWVFWRAGASRRWLTTAGLVLAGWVWGLDGGLVGQALFPAKMSGVAFLGVVVAGVLLVGAMLATPPVRAMVARLEHGELLALQGVRVLFGATFLVQGLVGVLPRAFGVLDGLTHTAAGLLALAATVAFRRTGEPSRLTWVANVFGLVDILVVASTLAFVLLPTLTPHHAMMYAVFLPAPFWVWWHVVSLGRLARGSAEAPAPPPSAASLGTLSVMALGLVLSLSGCRSFVLRTVMGTVEPYFHGAGVDGVKLERLTDHVYTFQWNWYRNLVVVTDEGLMVIDPEGPAAPALAAELSRVFPGKKVKRLVYSHYHLDHVRGGAVFSPEEVLAHEKCPEYWAPFDPHDVVPPTRLLQGDVDLSLGGVTIQALYLGLSHTDTLYAFYLPQERVLFTADLGLVRAVAPVGVPDRYAPGYLTALDRLAALDFDVFVPSHFGYGKKQDLIDWRNMLEDGRRLAREAIARSGTFGVQEDQLTEYFDAIYYPLREKYGDWHGFDEMAVLNIVRDIEGEGLGH